MAIVTKFVHIFGIEPMKENPVPVAILRVQLDELNLWKHFITAHHAQFWGYADECLLFMADATCWEWNERLVHAHDHNFGMLVKTAKQRAEAYWLKQATTKPTNS